MKNKRNKFKLQLIKYGIIIALFAVGIGASGTEIGWENIDEFGFEAILEESRESVRRYSKHNVGISKQARNT